MYANWVQVLPSDLSSCSHILLANVIKYLKDHHLQRFALVISSINQKVHNRAGRAGRGGIFMGTHHAHTTTAAGARPREQYEKGMETAQEKCCHSSSGKLCLISRGKSLQCCEEWAHSITKAKGWKGLS